MVRSFSRRVMREEGRISHVSEEGQLKARRKEKRERDRRLLPKPECIKS